MQLNKKITPFLWFDGKAAEAAAFYTSIFKNAKITGTTYYGEGGPGPKGSVLTVTFELDGQEFVGLNGGPHYSFTPAVSFFIQCETQEEVDHYWDSLLAGGQPMQCGWLSDKYGVSWQVVPRMLGAFLVDKDKARSQRVMQAMMKMVKLDVATLQRAADAT
jgi:predicted 3-demethylubiquinone-9 3-methyltransferase (glyoxalase superfamily)